MVFQSARYKNGYGLIGLLIAVALVGILAVGGFYINSSGERKSSIEINRDALKRAEELQKMVEERNRQTEEAGATYPNNTIITSTECVARGGEIVNTLSEPLLQITTENFMGRVSGLKCPCVCLQVIR